MELHLRYKNAIPLVDAPYADKIVEVTTQEEWRTHAIQPDVISSVLWPTGTKPIPFVGKNLYTKSHHHETGYEHYERDGEIRSSFKEATTRLAAKLSDTLRTMRFNGMPKTLVYAPLRGAYPIWRAIAWHLSPKYFTTIYPVTSSFVSYPVEFGYRAKKGNNASGRYTNILELQRLKPILGNYECLVYVDEIISGGMMRGHIKEMMALGVMNDIRVVVVGLADRFGTRAKNNIERFEAMGRQNDLYAFHWEGCKELITEDQKFLLGMHYTEHRLGPHVVPVLDAEGKFFPEKTAFEVEVFGRDPGIFRP